MLRIRSVRCVGEFAVQLGLTDGCERQIDLEPYLVGPIFAPLKVDRELFRQIRVDDELGTIVWPNGADIFPDVLIHGRTPVALEGAPGSPLPHGGPEGEGARKPHPS